jgi:uncharacterized protein YjbJ (UPF0337 family)
MTLLLSDRSEIDGKRTSNFNRAKGGNVMKQGTQDKGKGKLHEMKGRVKEKVGRAMNNPNWEAEGIVEKIAGKVQRKIGQVKNAFGK